MGEAMTFEEIARIVAEIEYKPGWNVLLRVDRAFLGDQWGDVLTPSKEDAQKFAGMVKLYRDTYGQAMPQPMREKLQHKLGFKPRPLTINRLPAFVGVDFGKMERTVIVHARKQGQTWATMGAHYHGHMLDYLKQMEAARHLVTGVDDV